MFDGQRIKALRKKNKITQQQLAEHLGINDKTVSRYENNNIFPSYEVMVTIAQYFDVSLDYFFELTDEEFPIDKENYITLPKGYPPEYKKAMLYLKDLLNKNYDLK